MLVITLLTSNQLPTGTELSLKYRIVVNVYETGKVMMVSKQTDLVDMSESLFH